MAPDKVVFYHCFYLVVIFVITDQLHDLEQSGVGCNVGGVFINVLAQWRLTPLSWPMRMTLCLYSTILGGLCKNYLLYSTNILLK